MDKWQRELHSLIGLVLICQIVLADGNMSTVDLPLAPTFAKQQTLSPAGDAGIHTTSSLPEQGRVSQAQVIESFHVKSDIRYRFATTQMVSVVRNTAKQAKEISFDVVLPKEAFIVRFSMETGGQVYDGEVKEKSEAKKQFMAAVALGQSAGHIRQAPRHSNVFDVSVNVASGENVTFTLTYQEMLQRKLGLYEHEIHVNPGQPVHDFTIEIYIQEKQVIKSVKIPALRREELISNEVEAINELAVVNHVSPQALHIVYKPSVTEQGSLTQSARFAVQYDVEHSHKGDVLVVDGYFIHFFTPDLPPMPKDIIFLLDVSGSMSGQKISQLREAMITILKALQHQDRFNIITFSSYVNHWDTGLVSATGETLKRAIEFVQTIQASSETNMNAALVSALAELRAGQSKERVPMLFFLTDGQPTSGETKLEQIAANVLASNANLAAIFSLAFGDGADYDFLKKISTQNSGFARKIYVASDAALQVSSLYKEISAVAMKELSVDYLASSVDIYSVTERTFPVVFNGSEVIICGKMAQEARSFQAEIKALQKSGEVDMLLQVDNMNNIIVDNSDSSANPFFTLPRDYASIVERMWAYLSIKQLLRQKERQDSNTTLDQQLKEKILNTALKYKFVTPMTSMVVTKPQESNQATELGLRDGDKMSKPIYQLSQLSGLSYNRYHHFAPVHDLGLHSSPYGPAGFPMMFNAMQPARPLPRRRFSPRPVSTMSTGTAVRTVTVRHGNRSICLVLSRLTGTYNFLRFENGSSISVQFSCLDKTCKPQQVKEVVYTSASGRCVVFSNGNGAPCQSGTHQDDEFTFISKKVARKRSQMYTFELLLHAVPASPSLVGDLLNMPWRKMKKMRQKKKVPLACQKEGATFSMTVHMPRAAKYAINSWPDLLPYSWR